MRQRCPSSSFFKRAFLLGYKLIFEGYSINWKGPVSNVVESSDDIVWGGIFKINEDDLAALDCYEGYPKSYNRRQVALEDDEGKEFRAILYYRVSRGSGEPSRDYLNKIIEGARDCGLPEEYIIKLSELLDSGEGLR